MKDIRPALRAFLLADAGISAAVGAARIYPVKLPQGKILPSVVLLRVGGRGDHHHGGRSGINRGRYQIDCWAAAEDDAASLANRVKDRLDGYKGVMGAGPNAVNVQGVFFDGIERESYDAEAVLHVVGRDFALWIEEV